MPSCFGGHYYQEIFIEDELDQQGISLPVASRASEIGERFNLSVRESLWLARREVRDREIQSLINMGLIDSGANAPGDSSAQAVLSNNIPEPVPDLTPRERLGLNPDAFRWMTSNYDEANLESNIRVVNKPLRQTKCHVCGVNLSDGKYKGNIIHYGRSGKLYYCEKCAKETLFSCNSCGNYYELTDEYEDVNKANGGKMRLCATCSFHNVVTCHICNQRRLSGDTIYFGDTGEAAVRICYECARKYVSECNSCGRSVLTEQIVTVVRNNRTARVCQLCAEEIRLGGHHRRECSLDYRSPGGFYTRGLKPGKLITDMHTVGTEIEVEGLDTKSDLSDSDFPGSIGLTHDGSLNDGLEVLTPPRQGNLLEKIITETCQTLKDHHLDVSIRCGLHVHIGLSPDEKTHENLLKIFETYYYLEDILFAMLPFSRRNNRYCRPLKSGFKVSDFEGKTRADRLIYRTESNSVMNSRKGNKYDGSRYYFLNLHSVFHRGTVEIRSHSGTLNAVKILNWIYLNLQIVDFALNKLTRINRLKLKLIAKTADQVEAAKKMCELLEIREDVANYILSRIKLFNRKD